MSASLAALPAGDRLAVTVLGAGAWGTAFAALAARRHAVRLWSRDPELAAAITRDGENRRYLPGVNLPADIAVGSDLDAATGGAQVAVSAVPASAMLDVLGRCSPLAARVPLLWLSKGFVGSAAREAIRLPHQAVAELWSAPSAVLSGPSFASEVACGMPTAVTVAASDLATARWFAGAFRFDSLRTYASDDLVGVETGGAVKNVLAIAAGICDGLGFGHNARAALITRGLAETCRLAEALGGRRETLMGLSGLGDLVLTCTGDLSRNRRVGIALARGEILASILESLGHVAEGVTTARRLAVLTRGTGIDMPIAAAVHEVLFDGKAPRVAVEELLAREPRIEGN